MRAERKVALLSLDVFTTVSRRPAAATILRHLPQQNLSANTPNQLYRTGRNSRPGQRYCNRTRQNTTAHSNRKKRCPIARASDAQSSTKLLSSACECFVFVTKRLAERDWIDAGKHNSKSPSTQAVCAEFSPIPASEQSATHASPMHCLATPLHEFELKY